MAKRIGKGLSALLANIEDERVLPVQPTEVVEGEKVYNIELDLIEANPNQPRKYFGEKTYLLCRKLRNLPCPAVKLMQYHSCRQISSVPKGYA